MVDRHACLGQPIRVQPLLGCGLTSLVLVVAAEPAPGDGAQPGRHHRLPPVASSRAHGLEVRVLHDVLSGLAVTTDPSEHEAIEKVTGLVEQAPHCLGLACSRGPQEFHVRLCGQRHGHHRPLWCVGRAWINRRTLAVALATVATWWEPTTDWP